MWGWLGRSFGIDFSEVDQPLTEFESFDSFFTRTLPAGARILTGEGNALLSPADGVFAPVVLSSDDTLIAAKGRSYSMVDWFSIIELPWQDPRCNVIYLSPKNYHRVHAPLGGQIVKVHYEPGNLFTVNPNRVRDITKIWGVNERVSLWLKTEFGPVAICLVGALCVGSIEMTVLPLPLNRFSGRQPVTHEFPDGGIRVQQGEQLGMFHMGSTVLVAFEGTGYQSDRLFETESPIQLGQTLGKWPDHAIE
jgi:phosphatidylserine decarboxylase